MEPLGLKGNQLGIVLVKRTGELELPHNLEVAHRLVVAHRLEAAHRQVVGRLVVGHRLADLEVQIDRRR